MKDYKEFYKLVQTDAETSSTKQPRVRDYIFIKCADNVFVIILMVLVVGFFGMTFFLDEASHAERIKFCLNASNLCLGVFLGLFAGRNIK